MKLVKLKEKNDINIVNNIIDFKNPTYIYIPILEPKTFKMNDYVNKNTYFGNYIASVSGRIVGSKKVIVNKKTISAIVIENDYKENSQRKNKLKNVKNKDDLINVLKEYLLDDVAKKISNLNNISNLIISSIDEEEYSVREFSRLSNNYQEILDTIDCLLNIFNLNKAVLATKNTSFKSIKNVKSIIGTYPNIEISLIPDKYLISYKNFLCEFLNISLNDTLVLTTNELYSIYNVLKKGKNITENLITISGNGIEKSLIINVRLNTSLEEIVNEYINIICKNYEIFLNGYLMGEKVDNIKDIIITKDVNLIVINKKEEQEETKCINCGACYKICPFNINIKNCYYKNLSHKNCIGCGLCNYVCPANIDLKKLIKGE